MRKVFFTRPFPKIAKEILVEHGFQVEEHQRSFLEKNEWIHAVQNYDALLTSVWDRLDAEILSKATRLKIISNFGVGLDNIDVFSAEEKGITVCNLPNIVTESSADHTFAIFLALVRKICAANQFVKEGKWDYWTYDLFLGEELFSKTFGILGMGRIGQAVAKRALAFGLSVMYCNRSDPKLSSELKNCKRVDFETLLKESDYLSLHVSLNPETKHLINDKAFALMKKRPILINMARGEVVSTEALIEALQKKKIRGAALDVTSPEPLPKDHPLLKFPECLITPHIGTSTLECRHQMAKSAAEHIVFYFEQQIS